MSLDGREQASCDVPQAAGRRTSPVLLVCMGLGIARSFISRRGKPAADRKAKRAHKKESVQENVT